MGSGGSKNTAKVVKETRNESSNKQLKNGHVKDTTQVNSKPTTNTITNGKVNQSQTNTKQQDDLEEVRRKVEEGKNLLRQRTLFTHTTNDNNDKATKKEVHSLFKGNILTDCPSTAKIVRIFTSSTFKDTEHERNMLMDKAYPKIKSFCQDRGYEFQVVDMRWGVSDEATDDHLGTELCLRELQLCKKLSTGPNFVCMLSHRYGNRSLLREVDAKEFETLFKSVESDKVKKLLKKWFWRDDNAVPPVYVLQPISSFIPDYISDDREKKLVAREQWNEENSAMQDTLAEVAEKILGPEEAKKYTICVTEKEIHMGMLQCFDAHSSCAWFKRKIVDIEKQEPTKQLSRYIECLGPEEQWRKARELHKQLSEEKIPSVLPKHKIYNYEVKWTPVGIDPKNDVHKKYLEKLGKDFVTSMCNMVKEGIERRSLSDISDPLYEECYLHSSFCRSKCEDFQGREETLKKIEAYIHNKNCQPLVVHGVSGCGKTSIMAKAAQLSWKWMKERASIVLRFVGTTPDSSNINGFLANVTLQIKKNYGEDSNIPEDLGELKQEFQSSLHLARWNHPLVLVIDSLDQFDPAHGARTLSWLPTTLPPHVKLLVSTLEEEQYESFQKLKSKNLPKENYIPVPKLPDGDVSSIIDHWLAKRGRTLLAGQRQVLLKSFQKCPLPIFLKLSFDEACRWTSYADKSTTVLQTTVRHSINTLFSRIELIHGEIFVSRALGYLTAARSGLSTAELEDVLACDDDVLNSLFSHWTPPMRRLPPLLLIRLKSDLQQYLVERGADGIRVLFWYHRQFIEAANDRYCGAGVVQRLHAGLAEFFSGTWSQGKPKPYTDKSGKEVLADRHVTSQPLQFVNTYNIRKINNLPHHRTLAEHLDHLKDECLCNFDFLLAKLSTGSIRQVIDDYVLALKKFPEDKEIGLITDALQLSQSALIYDPLQLAPQMLDRLAGEKVVSSFLKQCESFSIPFLKPSTEILAKPGGQLVYCLAGHTEPVRGLDMKKNGREVVTCSEDDTIKTWDIVEGRMIKSYDGYGIDPDCVKYIMNDQIIFAHYQRRIKGIKLTGEEAYTIETSGNGVAFGIAGRNKSIIAIFEDNSAKLYDGSSGNLVNTIQQSDTVPFQQEGQVPGSENFMIIKSNDGQQFAVLDIKNKSFSEFTSAFKPDKQGVRPEIEALVISTNEKYVFCLNYISSNVFIYDITTLNEHMVLKGNQRDLSHNLHVTPNGKYLYSPSNKHVSVKNLENGTVELVLEHPADVDDVVSVDALTFVTRSDDVVIRVWDLSRKEKEDNTSDLSHSDRVTKMEPMPNCRYVVCLSKAVDKSNMEVSVYLQVYDLAENVIVRQAEVTDSEARVLKVLNDYEIIIATFSKKLKVVNVDKMSVVRVFEGKINKKIPDILVLKDGKEVVVPTVGMMCLKVYDTTTGKIKSVLKASQNEPIDEIKASADGSVVLAGTTDGPYLVFDLKKGNLIKMLYEKDFGFLEFLSTESMISSCMVSSNGNYIGISGTKSVPIPTLDGETSDENMLCIWDVRAGKKMHDLYDEVYHTKYETKENRKGLSIGVDEVVNIGDSLILTAHDDFIVRVWDIKSGRLLNHLFGHTSNVELRVLEKSPYILTYGCWEEENALRLWDKQRYECIASYKLDKLLSKNVWCSDGRSFISTMKDPAKIVHWTLNGTNSSSRMAAYPVIFKGKICDLNIEFEHEDDEKIDPDDPDQDDEDE